MLLNVCTEGAKSVLNRNSEWISLYKQEQSVYLLQISGFYGREFEIWPCAVLRFDTDVSDDCAISTI
jgi:hypothetical protein